MAGFSTTLAGQTSPQDYPQWRGQHRDGAASAFSEPDTWPDALTRHWTVEVGDGYATPIIVGSTVYTFTRQGDDEVVTAIDAATGEMAWDSRYRAPHGVHQAAAAHTTGPKATPLFHNGMVFTLGISGVVSAFEAASGALVWQTDAPDSLPIYGNPVSPLGVGELVIVHPGDYGSLTAFEAATGETAWTATGTGVCSPASIDFAWAILFPRPLCCTIRGDQVIHSANFDHLRVSIFPLTAIPIACFCPTKTTSFLPRVMPV